MAIATQARTDVATPADLPFVKAATKTATGELGFIVWPKIEWLQRQGDVVILRCNDERCGFAVHGRTPPLIKIWQLWVRDDARRIEHGTMLVRHVVRTATEHDGYGLSVRCATDLPAMAFWKNLGFDRLRTVAGGKRRRRSIAQFHRPLGVLERLGLIVS